MPTLKLPLSGDVSQTINPWTWMIKTVGGQFGLVNINFGKSSDPGLEEQILEEVGTYGRQLGQIGDALLVLLDNVKLPGLSIEEELAIDSFKLQLKQIARLKEQRRAAPAS